MKKKRKRIDRGTETLHPLSLLQQFSPQFLRPPCPRLVPVQSRCPIKLIGAGRFVWHKLGAERCTWKVSGGRKGRHFSYT